MDRPLYDSCQLFWVQYHHRPVFSERMGVNIAGLFTIGLRRLEQPALTMEELVRMDLILISDAHFDHLDTASMKRFDRSIPIIMRKTRLMSLRISNLRRFANLTGGH